MATSQQPPKQPRRQGKPIQDVTGPDSFPAVGMTLSSYSHDPFTQMKADSKKPQLPPQSRLQRFRSAVSLKRVTLTLVIVVLLAVGWLGWKFLYNAHKLFGGNVLSIFTTSRLDGESSGRVNILLAGNSADDKGHQGGQLTDSIMIVSIDTKSNKAFMLSVPRDLYVAIPGHGHQKINAAYVDGTNDKFSQSGYPKGGMGLLEKVIEQNFGINLNYYALIDYNAFRQGVDAVGGIDITVQSTDKRGLYDPDIDYATHKVLVKLSNGSHHLDGEQALDLARARGDAPGSYGFPMADFDRTTHQRQMLVALKAKATTAGVVTNPVRLGQLFDAAGNNVKTDFTLSNVHRLYDVTKNISGNNIQSLSLNNVNGTNLLASSRQQGQDVLIPAAGLDNFSQIRTYLQRLTSNNPVVKEGATIVVLNATNVNGVAAAQAKLLQAKFINVTAVADATTTSATTQIIDNTAGNKPATKLLLEALYGKNITTTNPYSAYKADFIVVVGTDKLAH